MRDVIAGFLVSLAVVGTACCTVVLDIAGSWPLISMPLVSLALPLAMPNGRWLLGCSTFFLVAATGLLSFHFYQVSNTPIRGGSAGEAIGLAFFALVVATFIVGALVKGIYFRVKAGRRARLSGDDAPKKSVERARGR
jgi:uncharacterized membrane protein